MVSKEFVKKILFVKKLQIVDDRDELIGNEIKSGEVIFMWETK